MKIFSKIDIKEEIKELNSFKNNDEVILYLKTLFKKNNPNIDLNSNHLIYTAKYYKNCIVFFENNGINQAFESLSMDNCFLISTPLLYSKKIM
jgi:hypothetical protein